MSGCWFTILWSPPLKSRGLAEVWGSLPRERELQCMDSNHRPPEDGSGALPTELHCRKIHIGIRISVVSSVKQQLCSRCPGNATPTYGELAREVRILHRRIERLTDELNLYRRHSLPLATELVLESITINDHIKITGTIMSLQMKPTDYALLVLAPVAKDAQGNKTPSEIKAGSVLSAIINDANGAPLNGLVTLAFDPNNPLRLKIAGVPSNAVGGQATLLVSGINDAGSTISFTDTVIIAGSTPPPSGSRHGTRRYLFRSVRSDRSASSLLTIEDDN